MYVRDKCHCVAPATRASLDNTCDGLTETNDKILRKHQISKLLLSRLEMLLTCSFLDSTKRKNHKLDLTLQVTLPFASLNFPKLLKTSRRSVKGASLATFLSYPQHTMVSWSSRAKTYRLQWNKVLFRQELQTAALWLLWA